MLDLSRRRLVVLFVLVGAIAGISPASAQKTACNSADDYSRALCLYRAGDLLEAASLFAKVAESDEPSPEVLKSQYFLARIDMRNKQWREASRRLIRIYSLSQSFYDDWNCDYLLGECRRAMGEE